MKNDEIKQANRKALPKFLFFVVGSALVGGVIGYFSADTESESLVAMIKNAGAFFGVRIAPWLMLALAILVPVICLPLYRSAKKLAAVWDDEDEDLYNTIDQKLSVAVWLADAALILAVFLITATYSVGMEGIDNANGFVFFFINIAAFFAIMVEATVFQQKCVDTTKQLNPEKKASVYDMQFHKKWMADCDEAEKIIIGKCAYKAYSATNIVCAVCAVVLAVCALTFNIGFLPSLIVCLIWMVNLSVYCCEALRYSKAGNKIS
ncbi:DUF3169 family protein [uncultured Gemmiger sp.]|uniref:DUF3169 family protein n=1 Tax=uncultured Gemmiger sp. TaxID=1623490 RepID=UPI0025F13D6F|nr:DUF3169 family protein [uncultured Gemmiger sp.]